jgi:subtilase family serine protease
MKRKVGLFSIAVALVGFFVGASIISAAPPNSQTPILMQGLPEERPTMQKPPPVPPPKKCPDATVAGIEVTLVSTELGKPGVEFPKDQVKVSFTIKNVGGATLIKQPPPPAGGYILSQLNIYRNGQNFGGVGIPELSPGDTWVYKRDDTFPHGVKTTYKGVIIYGANECRTDNNEMSLTVDETKLHPAQTLPDLVPVNTWPNFGEHGFCKLNNDKLEVTVKNQGAANAAPSTTKVVLSNGKATALPTAGIPKGGLAVLLFDLPVNCFSSSDCSFTITVDSQNVVTESNEVNNNAHGRCYPY